MREAYEKIAEKEREQQQARFKELCKLLENPAYQKAASWTLSHDDFSIAKLKQLEKNMRKSAALEGEK